MVFKKITKVRWIADFRDPIYGNVAQVDMINPKRFIEKLKKKILRRYDRFIAKNADMLIANTENHADLLRKNYGCNHVEDVRNSYDSHDFDTPGIKKYNELPIAHVGSIYGKRNPDLLFSAIKKPSLEAAPKNFV